MNKKLFYMLIIFSLLATIILSINMFGASKNSSDVIVAVDGKILELDPGAVIIDSRTLVPLRGVFEHLGATVDWNKETNQVIVKNDNNEVLLEVGNLYVMVNGELKDLDVPSMLVDSRTLVPVRFVTEALGHKVEWDNENRQVIITTNDSYVYNKSDELPIVGNADNLYQLLRYNETLYNYIFNDFLVVDMMLAEDAVEVKSESSQAQGNESSSNSSDFSNTNVQTEGVDEGDIIKTNGTYLFSLSNNKIYIIETKPQNPKIISTIDIDKSEDSYATDIYIQGNKLIVIGTKRTYEKYSIEPSGGIEAQKEVSIMPIYNRVSTIVKVYDITNPDNPTIKYDNEYEGNYTSSRLIGDKLYLITNMNIYNHWGDDQLIQPCYIDRITGTKTHIELSEIRYFPDYVAPNYMLTIGFDLLTGISDVQSYLGAAEIVYASNDNLYLAFNKYEYSIMEDSEQYIPRYETSTTLYKFRFEEGKVIYKNSGSVDGKVLNQYSLDEYNKNLRVATTTGDMWDNSNLSKNNIYILDENLSHLGALTGLAEGERIYSTRFANERIYMVTFKEVDPFFVIDAGNPAEPKVLGYLKIPGFSTYMHILGDNHILGFGADTIENNGRITTGGLKLSLFDVTNPDNPIESKNEIIGNAGTYSEIQYNPKALMISLQKGLMAFPISVVGKTPYSYEFAGAYVYEIGTDDFNYLGNMTHHSSDTIIQEGNYKYTDYNYNINRVVYIGDYLYSVSNGKVMVTEIATMEKVGEVDLIVLNN
jgi:inhibitor of cysteine peptidase